MNNKLSHEEFLQYLSQSEIPPLPPVGSCLDGFMFADIHYKRREVLSFDQDFQEDINMYKVRQQCTQYYGMWAIVDKIWTKVLADWIGARSCLEIMAGRGWLAKALSEYGIDILATDNHSWKLPKKRHDLVFDVKGEKAQKAIKNHADRDILICSWPPYGDTTLINICQSWDGDIIYVGEKDGCNVPYEFFTYFQEYNHDKNIPLMSWYGLHDQVMLGRYNTTR